MIWLRRDEWELAGGPQEVWALVAAGRSALAEASVADDANSRAQVAARLARMRYHAARLAAEQFQLCWAIGRILARGGFAGPKAEASRDATPSPAAVRSFAIGVWCAAGSEAPSGDDDEWQRQLREAFGAGLWASERGPGRDVPVLRLNSEASSLNYDVYVLANDNRALRFKLAGWRARLSLAARGQSASSADTAEGEGERA